MPKTRITDETMRAIRGEAIYGFHKTGIRQADGTWLVEFDDEVAARLEEIALPGERVDDTIQRVIRQHRGDRPNGRRLRSPPAARPRAAVLVWRPHGGTHYTRRLLRAPSVWISSYR